MTTNTRGEAIAYEAKIQKIARLLWENGEMMSDWEGGAPPTWNDLISNPDYCKTPWFICRNECESYAKALIDSGYTDLAAQMREASGKLCVHLIYDREETEKVLMLIEPLTKAIAAYDKLMESKND